MSEWQITEQQLLDLNRFIHENETALVHNCMVRTAQESRLFPLMPYIMLSFVEAYYRWPDQLRRASAVLSPEDAGHRARNSTSRLTRLNAWTTIQFYLSARTELVKLGLIRPQDNLEDLWFVAAWWHRFTSAFRRNGGNQFTLDAWDIAQDHDERVLQVFEADAYEADAALRAAVSRFTAVATQYSFLAHCECRLGLHSSGPYNLGGRRLMHTRDFHDLSECDLPWLDGISTEIPYNNLTLVVITDGVQVEITDFASLFTVPESYQERIVGVGLYSSDFLTDRYVPVGMDSRRDCVDTLNALSELMKVATHKLYRRFSGWSFEQMVEAGVVTYFQAPSDLVHMAGHYHQSEWERMDDRTRALWPLFNEEYALSAWVSNMISHDGRAGGANDYHLHPVKYRGWRSAGADADLPAPGRFAQLVPASILRDHDYSRRANPNGLADHHTSSSIAGKTGRYTMLSGRLTEDAMNAAARAYASPLLDSPWRYIDETTVNWEWRSAEVDGLYRYTQERSRLLRGRGAGLLRADIDRLRRMAGERAWGDVTPAAGVD